MCRVCRLCRVFSLFSPTRVWEIGRWGLHNLHRLHTRGQNPTWQVTGGVCGKRERETVDLRTRWSDRHRPAVRRTLARCVGVRHRE